MTGLEPTASTTPRYKGNMLKPLKTLVLSCFSTLYMLKSFEVIRTFLSCFCRDSNFLRQIKSRSENFQNDFRISAGSCPVSYAAEKQRPAQQVVRIKTASRWLRPSAHRPRTFDLLNSHLISSPKTHKKSDSTKPIIILSLFEQKTKQQYAQTL